MYAAIISYTMTQVAVRKERVGCWVSVVDDVTDDCKLIQRYRPTFAVSVDIINTQTLFYCPHQSLIKINQIQQEFQDKTNHTLHTQ